MTLSDVYEEQLAWMLQTLRRLGVPERDCDDVAHDVFLVVHRRLPTYDTARPIRPWLFGIAYRIVRDRLRSPRRRLELVTSSEPEVPSVACLDQRLGARRDVERLLQVLARLDEERRAVFVMYELDGFSMPEIAVVLERPLNTLYSHLRRARSAVQEALLGELNREVGHGRR